MAGHIKRADIEILKLQLERLESIQSEKSSELGRQTLLK